jgi:hypothetical protein
VTLFAYSDLLLFTKEEEPGRCDVLRNPLYLQSVKLQEGKKDMGTLTCCWVCLVLHTRLASHLLLYLISAGGFYPRELPRRRAGRALDSRTLCSIPSVLVWPWEVTSLL